MKKLVTIIVLLGLLVLPGCGNLSPSNRGENRNKISNRGKMGDIQSELHNLQGSVNTELGNIRSENKINAERLDNLQQGIVAIRKENSGVQILQGDGVLILILSLAMVAVALVFIVMHFKSQAEKAAKAAQIMAEQIADRDDPELEENVFKAALHSTAEAEVLHAMKKYQKRN